MRTGFEEAPAEFQSASQIARIETELWAQREMYCPNCGNSHLSKFEANKPVADFYCQECGDQYELKSQGRKFGRKLANGAYGTKMQRLSSDSSPNLMLLQYDRANRSVRNMLLVPRAFFVPSVVEKRPPLKPTARRAGWVGSNILLHKIPRIGRISVISEGTIRNKRAVLEDWERIRFISERKSDARGWLVDVLQCVDMLGKDHFELSEIYEYEDYLSRLYPKNANIRPKIRQQLQVLRDNGHLEFLGGGEYRRL